MTSRERRKRREKRERVAENARRQAAALERQPPVYVGLSYEGDVYDQPYSYPPPLPACGHAGCRPDYCFAKPKSEVRKEPVTPSYKHIPYIFLMVFAFVLCVWNGAMMLMADESAKAGHPIPFRVGLAHFIVFAISLVLCIGIFLTGRWSAKEWAL